ncbi:MAG: hypothetical protein M1838_000472 [Thelocarpon superellum]|nr:MAG: hypothetical protein M1838_000472 [Thelocarpon superellum]
MASYPQYLRPASLSLDTSTHKAFDGEDASVLDEGILESSIDSTELFRDFADPDTVSSASSHTFYKNNAFAHNYPVSSWTSGSCTPTTVYDGFTAESFDGDASAAYTSGTPTTASSGGFDMNAPNGVSTTAAAIAFPVPASSGLPLSSPTTLADAAAIPKRNRPSSPLRPQSPLARRGDGIRKKNARFDIPAERNLHNIDHFIAQSSDDQEIKELKQQKRLLRNRQAALDSRQRKKQHTERLEEEKKTYTTIISDLEERVAELQIREAEHLRVEDEWKATRQHYDHFIDVLRLEKEEMVRSHTLETGDLRKKNAFLTEHVQKMESTAMSAVPSSSGFSADYSDLDSIAMEGNSWDQFGFIHDFSMEPEARPENALIFPGRKVDKAAHESDKPAASGLLLILLLCGAFVASKSSATSTPNLPRMPDEIIAASATVLDTLFKDAGVPSADARFPTTTMTQAMAPGPSGASWPLAKDELQAGGMIGLSGSSLDVLNHRLVQPTKEQEQEQLFSLSAQQYNDVTSQDFLRDPEHPVLSEGRRNLGASLAAMRQDHKGSAAEVYTRSLLWDKVPAEVVRDFAQFVADSNAASHRAADLPESA